MSLPPNTRLRMIRKLLVFISFCFIVSMFSYWLGTTPEENPNHDLYVEQKHLTIGELIAQDNYQHVFPLVNQGTQIVHVKDILTGCQCSAVTPSNFVLRPGESKELTATIDFRPRIQQDMTKAVVEKRITIRARYSNKHAKNASETKESVFHFQSKAVAPVYLSSTDLFLGDFYPGMEPKVSHTQIMLHNPTDDIAIETNSDFISVSYDKSESLIQITPAKYIPQGDHHGTILVSHLAENSTSKYELPISVRLNAIPPIQADIINNSNKGESKTKQELTLELHSLNDVPFKITSSHAETLFGKMSFSLPERFPDKESTSHTLRLSATPHSDNLNSCVFTFNTEQNGDRYEVKKNHYIICH